MSYLTLAAGIPAFSKAVISLWFRVPQASIDALGAVVSSDFFHHIIPLLTFGQPPTDIEYEPVVTDIAHWTYSPSDGQKPIMAISDYVNVGEEPIEPCYIGISRAHDDGTITLTFNIQMGIRATLTSCAWVPTGVTIYPIEDAEVSFDPGNGNVGIGLNAYGVYTTKDVSYIRTPAPDCFHIETQHVLEPDHWHHVLLSFDLSGSCTVGQPWASTTCKLWYAIDDVNYKGAENLGPNRDADDNLGPNDIVSDNIWGVSGGTSDPGLLFNQYVAAPSGSLTLAPVPSNGAPVGIPASVTYVDNIFRVEMAELQMFTGVTLDTGVQSKRRAFVNADGTSVLPEGTQDDPRAPAEKLLGKKPAILLHGSSDWQSGHNTGTLAGQFKPTAVIESYTPDPGSDALMLVCNVSMRPRRAVAAEMLEAASADDASGSTNIFDTLVDDPAFAQEDLDAHLGEIMLEAASAADAVGVASVYEAEVDETVTAADTLNGVVPTGPTFDPATTTNATLSNGNLTATHSSAASNSGARATTSHNSGKYYFEMKMLTTASGDCVGLCTPAATYNNVCSGSNANIAIAASNGNINFFGSFAGNIGGFSINGVLGVAVDFTAGLIWMRNGAGNWNGSGTANPATAAGGFSFTAGTTAMPVVGFGTNGSESWTANFGATSYANAAPSGFGNW